MRGADGLYPEIDARASGWMKVSELHDIYWEESGNPDGIPVVFLHGGPGGGTEPKYRRFFDPRRYRIVMFDQRGCGRSTPYACLEDNGTWQLVGDIERLRAMLGVERWHVFGGSWGSTLALAYAEAHPDRVSALILRGIFLLREREIRWFYQEGASWIFPDAWEAYLAPIPEAERGDLLNAYHRRLTGTDHEEQMRCARAWSVWEGTTSRLQTDPAMVERCGEDRFALAFARIESHYFVNRGFLESDGWLLANAHRIRHIPGAIVQGRYDVVCPMESAWLLHRAWPEAALTVVPDAGHSANEPGITAALVDATDRFAR